MPFVDVTTGPSHTRTLTMSRPEARNAMHTAMLGELLDAASDAIADDAVRVLVIAGGAGHFSAGADLKEELDRAGRVRRMELFTQVYELLATSTTPTIAAISGSCVGGGAEVAAACDLRVAAPGSRFRFPGAAMGIPVGPAKLVGLVGLGIAKDLVLTSRTIGAEEAARIGLVQRIAEDPVAEAHAMADAIAAHDAATVSYILAQFDTFSGVGDRVNAENDALHAITETDGDYAALTAPNPKTTSGWSATAWKHR